MQKIVDLGLSNDLVIYFIIFKNRLMNLIFNKLGYIVSYINR